jgi:hypothetical protein
MTGLPGFSLERINQSLGSDMADLHPTSFQGSMKQLSKDLGFGSWVPPLDMICTHPAGTRYSLKRLDQYHDSGLF